MLASLRYLDTFVKIDGDMAVCGAPAVHTSPPQQKIINKHAAI
jgi:hypothetical protein